MTSAGAAASEPLYFNDEGQPVYTYMVSVPHANKHLIRFPIAIEPTTLRRKGTHADSSLSTPSVLLKADTGADVNLMNRKTFDQLFDSKVLRPTPIRMENYGNSTVKVLGMFHAFLRWKDRVYRQLFYVTDCDRSPNLLSRDACYTLGVLKPCYTVERTLSAQQHLAPKTSLHQKMKGSDKKLSNDSKKQSISQSQLRDLPLMKQDILHVYSDVFTGIGKFPGMPYKFQLKENAKPARHAPRKVPIHLQDAFHSEIHNLEKLGILEETKDVTEWVNSFVIMEKKTPDVSNSQSDRKLWIYLDPRDLNEALEREPYYTQSIEEIMARFHGMTRFTIADFNKGYWMVELDPESRKYTTMALDIGRFQWTRLPMGSIVAQDVFQSKLDVIFLDIPGVTGIADDMVIYGKTDLEHDKHLINFLNICRKNTLMLNPDKMQFRLPQVSFFGHQWSAKGLSPDPKKIAVVRRMDLPGDVETMRSFLGLVNYLNRFSPRLAELNEPLREVCRQDTEFQLTKSVRVAFLKTKEEISKNVTLPYFNPRSDTTLQTDASRKGLGAVILQDSKPVMFASRALTGTEKNYQNLERECLAMIWGMEKFHYFLYGKHFTLETDQKPLVSIYKKHMVDISPRIQRLVVRSFPYQPFDVQYRRKVLEQIHEIHTHYPQSNGFAEALVGIAKKLMEKSLKEGKLWNFWSFTVQDHSNFINTPVSLEMLTGRIQVPSPLEMLTGTTLPSPLEMLTGRIQVPSPLDMLTGRKPTPISSTLPSPLEMLTGRKPRSNLPQIPSSIGHNMDTSRIHKELLRRQPTATSTGATVLELDNQFLSRKCMETFGEQLPSINQLLNQIPTGSGFQTTPS